MTELLLIRHGQSQFNAQHRWESWEHHSPLTAQGEAEAQALAERLAPEKDIAALYASPLTRARQTSQTVGKALGIPPVEVDGLREVNVGYVGGLTHEEFEARFPEEYPLWQDHSNMEFTWPGGELRADFFRRAARAADEIVARHPHDKVAVVCHGGVIRATLAYYLPADHSEWWAYPLHTGSLTRLQVTPNGSKLLTLNEYLAVEQTG